MWNEGQKTELSTQWSHGLLGRPENQLTGVGFVWGGYHRSKISQDFAGSRCLPVRLTRLNVRAVRAHGFYMDDYEDPVHGGTVRPGA